MGTIFLVSREIFFFLSHLNSHRDSFKFSMEVEMNGCLPFLDVTIHKEGNKLYTSIYRKPTRTDRYLNYNSYHHPKIKSGIVKCLAHRARTICSHDHLQYELNHLKNVFISNKYPETMVSRLLSKHLIKNNNKKDDDRDTKPPPLLVTPYVKGLSEKIERRCKSMNIRTAFSSKRTLRHELVGVKERVDL